LAAADFASDDDDDDDEDVAVEEEWADGRVTMMVSRRNARCEGRGDRIMVGLVFLTATPSVLCFGGGLTHTWRLCDFLLGECEYFLDLSGRENIFVPTDVTRPTAADHYVFKT